MTVLRITKPVTIDDVIRRWTDPTTRPVFAKNCLISNDQEGKACRCAQGDILHIAGVKDHALDIAEQEDADEKVAKLLGIGLFQAVLLRVVNDSAEGCPERALTDPESLLGPEWRMMFHLAGVMEKASVRVWQRANSVAYRNGFTNDYGVRQGGSGLAGKAHNRFNWALKVMDQITFRKRIKADVWRSIEAEIVAEVYQPDHPFTQRLLPVFGFETIEALRQAAEGAA